MESHNSLQNAVEIHGSPSVMVVFVTELKGSLQYAEKWYQVDSKSIKENTRRVEDFHKASLQAIEAHVDALKAL